MNPTSTSNATAAASVGTSCITRTAPRTISNQGSTGTTNDGAPSPLACSGHAGPAASFDPPDTRNTSPSRIDATSPTADMIVRS